MDVNIIAAVIGAIGVIIAALITVFFTIRRKKPKYDEVSQKASAIQAGRDVILSGRDTNITEANETAFMSRATSNLVSKVADELILDQPLRRKWSSFDAKFLDTCFRHTPRGWVLDGAAIKSFQLWENDLLLDFGLQVYTRVCKELGKAHQDFDNLSIVSETYVSLRYLLRGLTILKHPKKDATLSDYSSLWDGSEAEWCLVVAPKENRAAGSWGAVIFNRKRRGALVINDRELHRDILERMKRANVPIFASPKAAVRSLAEGVNNSKNMKNDDVTALIVCKGCGNWIVVTDIPSPLSSVRIQCQDCGKDIELEPDDFTRVNLNK